MDCATGGGMKRKHPVAPLAAALVLACGLISFVGCDRGGGTGPDGARPGDGKSVGTAVLEAGSEVFQSEAPLRAIHAHVCGFHFYSGDMDRQVVAHHYCAHLSEELMQCVIFDSDEKDARLIGIEYIISARLFESLPEDEKKLWHSHGHEVKSGQLIAPGLPETAERELMKKLAGTYGKTWHTWQVDRGDELPLGIPQLMMSFTADGQVQESLVQERDARYGVSSEDRRELRSGIPNPGTVPGADAWTSGRTVQLEAVERETGQ